MKCTRDEAGSKQEGDKLSPDISFRPRYQASNFPRTNLFYLVLYLNRPISVYGDWQFRNMKTSDSCVMYGWLDPLEKPHSLIIFKIFLGQVCANKPSFWYFQALLVLFTK